MCSATFGDQMWSCRGVGLSRVMAAIRLRSGSTVSVVFETPGQFQRKREYTMKQFEEKEAAAKVAQERKDDLLGEMDRDEKKLKPKSFFGLF
jgi:hypothetical protein